MSTRQPTVEDLQELLISRMSARLGIEPQSIDVRERFSRYGLSSLDATILLAEIGAALGRPLASTLVWEYPTLGDLARHLAQGAGAPPASGGQSRTSASAASRLDEPIAVVGLACRFPKAPSAGAFWALLRGGVDAISEVPRDRWDIDDVYDPDLSAPGKMSTRWGGFLEGIDGFEPGFFGISPREASQMDPQQRLMLEVCWEALEDAGIPPGALKGSATGAFFGAMWSDYAKLVKGAEAIAQHTATGQDTSIIAGRISYSLGLQGPSMTVNTACSSSLVAVHLACQSLRCGESSLALAGGVNLIVAPESTIAMSKFGGMAPDGRSKAFDARANGYVRGEGAGVVVLKPLSRALADGDRIYCVIRGSAVNNDGFSNGLTAPNPQAQEALLRDAYERAGVAPHEVQYVEAHGTGTMLGDPIEAKALGAVLSADRPAERPLRLGSVKTNIGHIEAAAGVAGLIKLALSIRHGMLPPSLHFQEPNPHIPFEALRLRVQQALEPWPEEGDRLYAGVSSFGFGGTNCHVVVEGARAQRAELFALSGPGEALREAARALRARLGAPGPKPSLPELGARLAAALVDVPRAPHAPHRLAITARTHEELTERLDDFLLGRARPGTSTGQRGERPPRLVFMFGGHGSQWLGMGRDLLQDEPAFREALKRCDAAIRRQVGWSVLEELTRDGARSRVATEIDVIQPAIFAVQVALAALLRSLGVEPDAVVGHSIGEVAAAHVAGALDLDDAARVICRMSQLMNRVRGKGAMVLVELPQREAERALAGHADRLSVAVASSPSASVIAGDTAALSEVVATLEAQGVVCRPVKADYAPHSAHMDPLRADLLEALEGISARDGAVPFYSTVTGSPLPGAALDAGYWARNVREPVLFAQTVERLLGDGYDAFLDVTPHPVLTRSVEQCLPGAGRRGAVLCAARRGEPGRTVLLDALGALHALGKPVAWARLYPPDLDPEAPRAPAPADRAAEGDASPAGPAAPPPEELLVLSAQSAEGLRSLASTYHQGLLAASARRAGGDAPAQEPAWESAPLRDICYSASVRRGHAKHRLALLGSGKGELAEALGAFLKDGAHPRAAAGCVDAAARPRVVFVFPGQGSQWLGMGRQLLEQEPAFRAALEACGRAIHEEAGWSLLEELRADAERSRLARIDVVQPALFAIEVALAALWRSWGVEPDAVVGHSMGEVAAAHVAGALSLPDATRIICRRSALLRRVSGQGAMALVELSREEAEQVVADYQSLLSVAVCNSPRSTVVSGDPTALEEVLWFLERENVFCRRVKVDVASHSPQVDPLLEELRAALAGLAPAAAAVPMVSTVTGDRVGDGELDAGYWARNLREPVLFFQVVQRLIEGGHALFVEMSPHPILMPAVEEGLRHAGRAGAALPSLRREQDERRALLGSLAALYAQGCEVDWARFHSPGGRVLSLPAQPWQRERCWIGDAASPSGSPRSGAPARGLAAGHPLLGASFTTPTQPGARLFEQALSTTSLPYLADHRVQGEVVLPGAGYVEMALSAAAAAYGARAVGIESVTFERMLVLPPEGERVVQVALLEEGAQRASFQIFAQEGPDAGWQRYAAGRVRLGDSPVKPGSPAEAPRGILARCTEPLEGADHYRRMTERGLGYGARFQGVREGFRGVNELLARVALPEGLAAQAGKYRLHPSLLDAAFQVLVAALDRVEAVGAGNETYVPVALEGLYVHAPAGQEAWAHARLSAHEGAESVTGDVLLLGEEGEPLVEARGLRLRRLSPEARAPEEQHASWLYHLAWQRAEGAGEAPAASGDVSGQWLVLMDDGPVGKSLVPLLQAGGATCVRCFPGERYERIEPGLYRLDPADPRGFQALLEDAFPEGRPCRGAVYLWSLTATDAAETTLETLARDQQRGCHGALHLTQALLRRGWRDAPRLWVVTRGAQAAGEAPAGLSVAQAPLWGLGRVIALEHPELQCTRVDLSPAPMADEAQALLRELGSTDGEDQIALREAGRYVARLERGSLEPTAAEELDRPLPSLRAAEHPFQLEMTKPGVLEHLHLRAVRRRPPQRGEVEIAAEAVGLNFRDVLGAMGILPGINDVPLRLGAECSGRIVAVGEGVDGFAVGDEVVAAVFGCFGSFVTTAASSVAHKPARFSFEQAAAIPIAYMTAHYALNHLARLRRGESILIHSASGGTGLAAVQIAQALGVEVFATAGTEEKRAHLRALGVRHVMDSRSLAFGDEIMNLTNGRGVDAVLNSLTGDAILRSLEVLAPYGRFLEIGKRDIYENSRIGLLPFRKNLSYFAIDLAWMAMDRPDLFGVLLHEVLELFESRFLEAPGPLSAFPVSQVQEAFRLMAQAKHLGKIVVTLRDPAARLAPRSNAVEGIRADGTYLITGGLGGLGLSVAWWLVTQGARHVALLGRSSPSEDARATLRAMEEAGATVAVVQADVAQRAAMAAVLAQIGRTMPPLRGVVHAAGLLDDRTILQQDAARFQRVMAPKVEGAWNLHTLTRDTPLDFFVLYSSVVSLLGSPGQANYAAANAFLDALALQRRREGLPGLSIQWGPFAEVGLAAALTSRGERLATRGMDSLTPDQGILVLDRLLRQGKAQIGVVPLHVQQWMEFHPSAAGSKLWTRLEESSASGASAVAGSSVLEALSSAKPGARPALLERHVVEQIARVLRMDESKIGRKEALGKLGLDSLMSLELRNRLEASLGVKLSTALLFTYPTASALTEYLLTKLVPASAAEGAQAPVFEPRDSAITAHETGLQELSEQDAETLLEAKLAAFEENFR
ncbi:SDR family NAD(P)-dependent oxidoreductase [Sorangium sp. So ce1389]|uniref:SDR family NAD(P)-dependent oxidoreductase n=1 Tax=Sorangium sp. So ce1389 TaxID=3133336 RepID=UPI003F5DD90C